MAAACILLSSNVCWWLQRITAAQIYKNEWFQKNYKPSKLSEKKDVNLDDIDAVFNESTVRSSLSISLPKCWRCFLSCLWHHQSPSVMFGVGLEFVGMFNHSNRF